MEPEQQQSKVFFWDKTDKANDRKSKPKKLCTCN